MRFFWEAARRWLMRTTAARRQWRVQVRYGAPVDALELRDRRFVAAFCKGERIEARACVLAAADSSQNLEWLREAWGQNERGNGLVRIS